MKSLSYLLVVFAVWVAYLYPMYVAAMFHFEREEFWTMMFVIFVQPLGWAWGVCLIIVGLFT